MCTALGYPELVIALACCCSFVCFDCFYNVLICTSLILYKLINKNMLLTSTVKKVSQEYERSYLKLDAWASPWAFLFFFSLCRTALMFFPDIA